jgi:hypothetical protein
LANKKKELSPEAAEQAALMKARLEQLKAQRAERDSAHARGEMPVGGGSASGSVTGKQIRSGRRGNR